MFGWLKGKIAESREQADLAARIEQRFPSNVLYRVPQAVRDFLADGRRRQVPPVFEEVGMEWWADLLNSFPNPPSTESERKEREEYFWSTYAKHLSAVEPSGRSSLPPKQEILDFFQTHEKAIFRQYYAATGMVKKTVIEEVSRGWIKVSELTQLQNKNDARSDKEYKFAGTIYKKELIRQYGTESFKVTQSRILGAQAEIERMVKVTMPNHYQKEGDWFFTRVEDAFNRSTAPKDDAPVQNVYGIGGFAGRKDIDRLSQLRDLQSRFHREPASKPRAQDQEFDT